VKPGDLVIWSQGECEIPGLVLEIKPTRTVPEAAMISRYGLAVLAMLPALSEPEWFHERELEVINETR
jgi:hypothetical protein